MRLSTLFTVALLALLLAGGRAAEPEPDRIRVAASIYPITMLIHEIGGKRVYVTTVVPPGADPHHFELTPSSAKAVYESDALFMIGGDFDSFIMGGESSGMRVSVEFCDSFSDSLISLGNTFNPHFWLDPILAGKMGEYIGLTLISIDYGNHEYYERRMAVFRARIDSLHSAVKRRLEDGRFEKFVSFHPAWTYFARRYSLAEVGVVEKYPEHEPSAKWVAGLIAEIRRQRVEIMIVESTSDPGVVGGIVEDTGVTVLSLDPIGSPDLPGRDTYYGLIEHNISVIEQAAEGD